VYTLFVEFPGESSGNRVQALIALSNICPIKTHKSAELIFGSISVRSQDSYQHLTPGIFRRRGIEMLSIHADLAIAAGSHPLIAADMELFGRQYQQGFPILLKQFSNGACFL